MRPLIFLEGPSTPPSKWRYVLQFLLPPRVAGDFQNRPLWRLQERATPVDRHYLGALDAPQPQMLVGAL